MVKKIRAYGSDIGSSKKRFVSTGLIDLSARYVESIIVLKTGSNALVSLKDGEDVLMKFIPMGVHAPYSFPVELDLVDGLNVEIQYLDPEIFIPIDEQAGDKTEEVVTANDGRLKNMGNENWVKDRSRGWHLRFDGVDEYIQFEEDVMDWESDQSFSISFWMQAASTQTYARLMDKAKWSLPRKGFSIGLVSGELQFEIMDGTSTMIRKMFNENVCGDKKWHHIAITYDGSRDADGAKIFVDGVEVTDVTNVLDNLGTGTIKNESAFLLASWTSAGEPPFHGRLDKFMIYDRVVSDDVIDYLRRNGVTMHHTDGLEACELLIMYS